MTIMFVNIYSLLRGTFRRMNWKTKRKAKPFAHYKINYAKVIFSYSTHNQLENVREQRKGHINKNSTKSRTYEENYKTLLRFNT